MDYFMFWFYAGLAKLAWSFIVILIIFFIAFLCVLPKHIKQSFCSHDEFHENMACHGVCDKCNKDLGFIDDVCNQRKAKRGY